MIEALIINSEIMKFNRSFGSKSMLDINGSYKIIDQQIKTIKKINKNIKITISAGHQFENIRNYVTKYKNVTTNNNIYKSINEGYSLKFFFEQQKICDIKKLFIINGSILLKNNNIKISLNKKQKSTIYLLKGDKVNFDLGCGTDINPSYIFYGLDYKWAECILLDEQDIQIMKNILDSKFSVNNMFTFEIINTLFEMKKIPIHTEYINKNNILKIQDISDLKRAKYFV